jgi:hypothetical protein
LEERPPCSVGSKPVSYLQEEGPSARDLMVRYSTGRKTSKNKKKMEKAMKVLKVCKSLWIRASAK